VNGYVFGKGDVLNLRSDLGVIPGSVTKKEKLLCQAATIFLVTNDSSYDRSSLNANRE
jgi:hypothetical protein